jgi:hypothetical protein
MIKRENALGKFRWKKLYIDPPLALLVPRVKGPIRRVGNDEVNP